MMSKREIVCRERSSEMMSKFGKLLYPWPDRSGTRSDSRSSSRLPGPRSRWRRRGCTRWTGIHGDPRRFYGNSRVSTQSQSRTTAQQHRVKARRTHTRTVHASPPTPPGVTAARAEALQGSGCRAPRPSPDTSSARAGRPPGSGCQARHCRRGLGGGGCKERGW